MKKQEIEKTKTTQTTAVDGLPLHAMPVAQKAALIGKEWTPRVGELNPKRAIRWQGGNAPEDGSGSLIFATIGEDSSQEYLFLAGQLKAAEEAAGVTAFIERDGQVILLRGLIVKIDKNKVSFVKKGEAIEEEA